MSDRTCPRCGVKLSRYNKQPFCGPCTRSLPPGTKPSKKAPEEPQSIVAAPFEDRAEVERAWSRGGIPGLAEYLECDFHVALATAAACDLLPGKLATNLPFAHKLIDTHEDSPGLAAMKLESNRWTVADWRSTLQLPPWKRATSTIRRQK